MSYRFKKFYMYTYSTNSLSAMCFPFRFLGASSFWQDLHKTRLGSAEDGDVLVRGTDVGNVW